MTLIGVPVENLARLSIDLPSILNIVETDVFQKLHYESTLITIYLATQLSY
jgi:hypothetical protein